MQLTRLVSRWTANRVAQEGHLLAIHASLRRLFPQNRELVYCWMTADNEAFNGLTPVDMVRTEGLVGLRTVRAYLDDAIGK